MATRAWEADEDVDIDDCDVDESRNASDILKDANISEQVDHTWQLQRDWSLDYCEDEESKALIQQMLEEERYYAFGKKSTTIPIDQTVTVRENSEMCKEKLSGSRRVKWTDEEKQLFTQGMEIYGRSWTKVATLIPTKTLVQVRGYAARYNKMQEQISGPDKPSLDLLLETDRKNENKELQKVDKTDTEGSGNTTPKERKDRKKIKPVLNHLGNNCDLISKSDSSQISESKIRNENSTMTGHESVAEILRNANNERPRMVSILTHHHKMSNEETSDKNKTPNMISNCKGHKPFVHLLSEETSAITEDQPCIKSEADSDKSQETVHPNREPPRLGNEEVVRLQNMSSDDQTEDCDIDIDISDSEGQPESGNTEAKGKDLIYSALMQDAGLRMSSDEENDLEAAIKDNAMTNEDEPPNVNPVKTDSSSDEDSDDGPDPYLHENQYGVQNYKGEMEYMPNPTSELVLDKLNLVTEEEKEFHADYFSGNFPQRTPEAYMKIRNHILREWQKCKPEYLFKTTARNRLKNRGDVNRIGRIFSYLEQIGAINFGCTHCQYKRSKVQIRKKKKTKKYQAPVKLLQNYRKRKVRNIYGEWADPKDLEGLTVEHREPRQKSAKFTKKQYLYNPFDLIPCPAFSDTKKAPFTVIIDNSALVLMDTHSHLSKTEVIGLLGGRFQEELSTLRIHNAEPCDSISTGMQCEMDPVSQTMAAEKIEASGNRIVGWYHSHPTFAPYPSVRDMETQLQFQKWFAKGGHEFIGMIINPYRLISPQILSQITCLTVTEENKNDDRLGTPYRFEYKMDHTMWERDETLNKIQSLAEKYITFSSKVDMFSKTNERSNRAMTCLEKLLMALRCHIPAEEADTTCGQIEDIFVRIYSQYEVQRKEDVVD